MNANTEILDLDSELSDSAFEALDVTQTPETPVEDVVVDTVVLDDDLVVAPVETSGTPVSSATPTPKGSGRGRGRVASTEVADRRALSVRTASEVIRASTTPLTVSQIVRECEKLGVAHKSVWSDVYSFLNHGTHDFVEAPSTGSRAKWTSAPQSA